MTILHVVPKFNGLGGDTYTASYWLDVFPDIGAGDVVDVLLAVRTWLEDMYNQLEPAVSTLITAVEFALYVHDLVSGIDAPYADGNWSFAGTNTNESAAPQVSATVSAAVVGSPRPAQKRTIPFTEGVMSNGTLIAGWVTNLIAYGGTWFDGPTPAAGFTYQPGIRSVYGGTPVFRELSGTIAVPNTLGTVRSRKRGLGI